MPLSLARRMTAGEALASAGPMAGVMEMYSNLLYVGPRSGIAPNDRSL
ncbi:MAG: hypothetical protein ABI655_01710 [Phenylobacterium sp.]